MTLEKYTVLKQFYVSPAHIIRKWMNHACLYSQPQSVMHLGRYSFPIPLRVGDWVGLGYTPRWYYLRTSHVSKSGDWVRRKVTSLV